MSENTRIEWCDATFNPWEGCSKVSDGCANCYAEARAKRFTTAKWGPQGSRRVASESYWRQPLKWNREAKECGERRKVFCASLADVFEDWKGPMVGSGGVILGKDYRASVGPYRRLTMDDVRQRLFNLITDTDYLDWLLLTKRPENVEPLLRRVEGWALSNAWDEWVCYPENLHNVWLGVSVENQHAADERIPLLLQTPAAVRFLSCEPLLGPVDLLRVAWPGKAKPGSGGNEPHRVDVLRLGFWHDRLGFVNHGDMHDFTSPIDWVIVGGESGPGARPMYLSWARSIVRQCKKANVACFVKQLGACASDPENGIAGAKLCVPEEARPLISLRLRDAKGGCAEEWPVDLRVREFPETRR